MVGLNRFVMDDLLVNREITSVVKAMGSSFKVENERV